MAVKPVAPEECRPRVEAGVVQSETRTALVARKLPLGAFNLREFQVWQPAPRVPVAKSVRAAYRRLRRDVFRRMEDGHPSIAGIEAARCNGFERKG